MSGPSFPVLNEIVALFNKYPQVAGKPVVGWFCSYTPVEIFLAAGLRPYRIIPEPGRAGSRADGYIDRNFCPYVRSCLGEALDGKYDFLSGLVVVNSCDAMMRMYDVLRHNISGSFIHLLDLPRVANPAAADYFRENLHRLAREIESNINVKITEDTLSLAIDVTNRTRSLLKEIYQVNSRKGLPLSAVAVRDVVRAGAIIPADIFNGLLERLLVELDVYNSPDGEYPRILITGSVMDNPGILRLIEECGAKVAADDLCSGTRQFWDMIQRKSDALSDLSRHYLERTPCPRMKNAPRRFDHVLRLVDDFRVDGVIFYSMKFCDPFLFDAPSLKRRLVEKNIPVLSLEGDYTPGMPGRVRTRIEAFIEMLRQNVRVG